MERIVWVIGKNRADMIETQRSLGSHGNLRAICMLSYEKILKEVENCGELRQENSRTPALIILDWDSLQEEKAKVLDLLKSNQRLQGVPLFFMVRERNQQVDEECYDLGATVILHNPITRVELTRIERTVWQTLVTRNYEKMLQKQASELQSAREIWRLNQQLETRNQILSQIFGRYFSDEVAELILANPETAVLGGDKKRLTVMMADLRGFTSLSEKMDPLAVTDLLSFFFEQMSVAIQKYHGTIIEFLGDGILAVFGAPVETNEHTKEAIAAAITMQNKMKDVEAYCIQHHYPQLEMGIGLHAGEVFIGNVGSEKMMRYNVLGSAVNECSRIESVCIGGQIYISASSIQNCLNELEIADQTSIAVKGIQKPLEICRITGIKEPYGLNLKPEESHKVSQISQNVIFQIYPVEQKLIGPQSFCGKWISISGKCAVVELLEPIPQIERFMDVEIEAFEGEKVLFSKIYGKILKYEKPRLTLHFTRVNEKYQSYAVEAGITAQ